MQMYEKNKHPQQAAGLRHTGCWRILKGGQHFLAPPENIGLFRSRAVAGFAGVEAVALLWRWISPASVLSRLISLTLGLYGDPATADDYVPCGDAFVRTLNPLAFDDVSSVDLASSKQAAIQRRPNLSGAEQRRQP